MSKATAAIIDAGFMPLAGEEAAMRCPSSPEIWAAPDWDSLAYYATEFQLCYCPNH